MDCRLPNLINGVGGEMIQNKSLKFKLLATFLLVGLVPAVVLEWNESKLGKEITSSADKQVQSISVALGDKIDRNLFERYGDVQAFGLNTVVEDKSSWYQIGSKANKISLNSELT